MRWTIRTKSMISHSDSQEGGNAATTSSAETNAAGTTHQVILTLHVKVPVNSVDAPTYAEACAYALELLAALQLSLGGVPLEFTVDPLSC